MTRRITNISDEPKLAVEVTELGSFVIHQQDALDEDKRHRIFLRPREAREVLTALAEYCKEQGA